MLHLMNWKNLIDDLTKRGYTFASISREVGTTAAAIRALTVNCGQNPIWPTGNELIALHKKTMRKYPKVDTTA